MSARRAVRILGTRGVPAAHGGFETAVHNIGPRLVERGWDVTVYCQATGDGPVTEDHWSGVRRVVIPVDSTSALGTAQFDLKATRHAVRSGEICLTFGYNTAIFNTLVTARRLPNLINMDGIEWKRSGWNPAMRAFLWANEKVALGVGTHLIADHPEIARHLERSADTSRVSMIPYGADALLDEPEEPVRALGLEPGKYLTVICRPVPENSVLEVVRGFSAASRGVSLVVLGKFDPAGDPYHRAVLKAAGDEVIFPGPVYAPDVHSVRFHALGYIHGHTVGGTNPSLVEALGAGNPVIAHDNPYNRWVAGPDQLYFSSPDDLSAAVDRLLADERLRSDLTVAARHRHAEQFTWEQITDDYEFLLSTAATGPVARFRSARAPRQGR